MPLQVIIIGAGTGGTVAATALAKQGHSVTIYEREQSTTEIGFAFRITTNSVRCLKHLGIDPEAGGATQANTSRMFDQNGNIEREQRENKDQDKAKEAASVFASRVRCPDDHRCVAITNDVTAKTYFTDHRRGYCLWRPN